MNKLETAIVVGPYDKSGECAKFVIGDDSATFTFQSIVSIGEEYIYGGWVKSDAEGSLSMQGVTQTTTTEWTRFTSEFVAADDDLVMSFNAPGTYYIFQSKLENGNITTDWTPAPEDLVSQSKEYTDAQISITSDSIMGSVTSVQTTAESALNKATEVEATADGLTTTVQNNYNTLNSKFGSYYTKTEVDQKADSITLTAEEASAAASEAQTKAETAYNKASSLEVSVDGIEGRVTNVEGDVSTLTQTAEGLEIQIKSAMSRNLAANTGVGFILTPGAKYWFLPIGDVKLTEYSFERVKEGGYFTISFDWEAYSVTNAFDLGVSLRYTDASYQSLSGSTYTGDRNVPAGNSTGHLSITGEATSGQQADGDRFLFVGSLDTLDQNMILKVKNFKFEAGQNETVWSPAPEDLVSDSAVNIMQYDWLELYSAPSSNETLDKTSYLVDGSFKYSRGAFTNCGYYISNIDGFKGSSEYTIHFKARKTSGTITQFQVYKGLNHSSFKIYVDGVYKGVYGTNISFTMETNVWYDFVFYIETAASPALISSSYTGDIMQFQKSVADTFSVEVKDFMWTEGSGANSWSAAPGDEGRTASNYLKFDKSGLCVGDMTSGSLGYNTLIKPTGLSIRNGTTELASFSASSISSSQIKSSINLGGGIIIDATRVLGDATVEGYGTISNSLGRCSISMGISDVKIKSQSDMDLGTTAGDITLSPTVGSLCKTNTNYEIFGGRIIYNNASGSTADSITVTESFANFKFIDILFSTPNNEYDSVRVYSPNGKYVNLLTAIYIGSGSWIASKQFSLSGTKMSLRNSYKGRVWVGNNNYTEGYSGEFISVHWIIGWK